MAGNYLLPQQDCAVLNTTPTFTGSDFTGDKGSSTAPMDIRGHISRAWAFEDEFMSYAANLGHWAEDNATSGDVAASVAEGPGGVIELDSGAATVDQGVQIQAGGDGAGTALAFITPAAGTFIWFNARIKVNDTSSGQLFAGLAIVDTSVMASGENSTIDHIGWEIGATAQAANAGRLEFYGEKAGTRATITSAATTDMTDDTWYDIGFFVNGVTSITAFFDGAALASTIATASVPIVAMTPTFACLNEDGANQTKMYVDYVQTIVNRV